ncbi:putative membrane protein YeaQ/YmgE (transglycosylase-associated protein family) [Bradyrhizobium sp. USDA 4472]
MKRYLVFALVGPFVGGFLLLLTTTYQSGYWTQTSLDEVGKLFAVFFKSLQYSYLFGLLPSLMIGAVDDILIHVRRVRPGLRMLLVGLFAFILAAFTYGSRGPDSGAVQFILYGLVGFVPSVLSSWIVHHYVEEPQPAAAAS